MTRKTLQSLHEQYTFQKQKTKIQKQQNFLQPERNEKQKNFLQPEHNQNKKI